MNQLLTPRHRRPDGRALRQNAHSELEDVLAAACVAGPGAPNPGEPLSGSSEPLTREQALALALDLSRRSTPADGGFCTFQPVVQGGACPWNLDYENCDKFDLSGADLLYWRRKQEQWRSIAERAPTTPPPTIFTRFRTHRQSDRRPGEGTGRTRPARPSPGAGPTPPQDHVHRIWSTGFLTTDLADLSDDDTPLDRPAEQSA